MNEDPVWMEPVWGVDGYVTELRFSWPLPETQGAFYAFYASGKAAPSLLAEHADTRWERVVRRWEHKRVA